MENLSQPQIDLSKTTAITTESGGKVFQQGYYPAQSKQVYYWYTGRCIIAYSCVLRP